MYYKCDLLIGGYAYDVTDALVNWDDVELTLKRGDYDGVVRSFSTKFEFSTSGYSLLVGEYVDKYLGATASVVFYKRNNSWLWDEVFRCALDFSTFSYDGMTCQINAIDDSLAAIIKAKKGTEYEYSVDVIKESVPLRYDHLTMINSAKWLFPTDEDTEGLEMIVEGRGYYAIPTYYESTELYRTGVEIADQEKGFFTLDVTNPSTLKEMPYFIKNVGLETITVHVKCSFELIYNASSDDDKIGILYNNGSIPLFIEHLSLTTEAKIYTVKFDVYYSLRPDTSLVLAMYNANNLTTTQTIYNITEPLSISFNSRSEAVNIDVVKPVTVLNRLLQSMNGGKEGLTGEIADSDERLNNTLLVAADSCRGLSGAKLFSSYTKFVNWMAAEFGFVPVIQENGVKFVHRSVLFQDVEAKDLGDDCNEFEYSVNASLIHARVRVGYDKVDYEKVNGKGEHRFTMTYETGNTLTDTSLDLISPYRADAYGIEFLIAKRGEDSTDTDSDNDVFMIGAALNEAGSRYELIREGYTGSEASMFNLMYSQPFMIEANRGWIGVGCDKLTFASSDGNSNLYINGVHLTSDIAIADRLFTVGEVQVETSDEAVPSDLSGYISVTKNGKTYLGYLKDVDFGVGQTKSVKYSLIVREIV